MSIIEYLDYSWAEVDLVFSGPSLPFFSFSFNYCTISWVELPCLIVATYQLSKLVIIPIVVNITKILRQQPLRYMYPTASSSSCTTEPHGTEIGQSDKMPAVPEPRFFLSYRARLIKIPSR